MKGGGVLELGFAKNRQHVLHAFGLVERVGIF